jgi:hypothetical protein
MFGSYTQSVGAPNGATGTFGPTVDVVVTSHDALAVGDCVALPTPNVYNTTTGEVGWTTGSSTSQPAAADFVPETRKIFGIVMTATTASSKPVRVRLRGACLAKTAASTTAYKPVMPTASSYTLSAAAAAASGNATVGFNLVAVGLSVAVSPCMFDGLYGFGGVQEA